MIVGAILTQSVSWANVTKAIANLKRVDALEPAVLAAMPVGELAQLIRSSRFYNMKAGKIVAFLEHLIDYDYDLDAFFSKDVVALRGELLSIKGVGMETADSIILYGAHKPIFVIDAYTRQLMARLGLVPSQIGYEQLRSFFEINLPSDLSLFQEYHALIVHHCNRTCQKRPSCMGCPLISLCQFAGAN
ncbi:MAG: endonuclease [Chloroflexi bacterium]|nr:endonuclease [Chloroflexota bacterium]